MGHPDNLLNPVFTFVPDFDWSQDLFDFPCSGTFLGYGEEMGLLPVRGYSQRFSRQDLEDIKDEIARQGYEIANLQAQPSEVPLSEQELPIPREEAHTSRTAPNAPIKRKGTRLNGPTRG